MNIILKPRLMQSFPLINIVESLPTLRIAVLSFSLITVGCEESNTSNTSDDSSPESATSINEDHKTEISTNTVTPVKEATTTSIPEKTVEQTEVEESVKIEAPAKIDPNRSLSEQHIKNIESNRYWNELLSENEDYILTIPNPEERLEIDQVYFINQLTFCLEWAMLTQFSYYRDENKKENWWRKNWVQEPHENEFSRNRARGEEQEMAASIGNKIIDRFDSLQVETEMIMTFNSYDFTRKGFTMSKHLNAGIYPYTYERPYGIEKLKYRQEFSAPFYWPVGKEFSAVGQIGLLQMDEAVAERLREKYPKSSKIRILFSGRLTQSDLAGHPIGLQFDKIRVIDADKDSNPEDFVPSDFFDDKLELIAIDENSSLLRYSP